MNDTVPQFFSFASREIGSQFGSHEFFSFLRESPRQGTAPQQTKQVIYPGYLAVSGFASFIPAYSAWCLSPFGVAYLVDDITDALKPSPGGNITDSWIIGTY